MFEEYVGDKKKNRREDNETIYNISIVSFNAFKSQSTRPQKSHTRTMYEVERQIQPQ